MAPAASLSQDLRVRTPTTTTAPTSLGAQLEHKSIITAEPPAHCQSACCDTPVRRLMLRRNTASVHRALLAEAVYGTGTDGALLQSDDGSVPDFGEHIDSATFEQ
ncbi:hypothetical protein LTR53_015349, partial [Teratosphaeriaceae sp. CCFEE 6253]